MNHQGSACRTHVFGNSEQTDSAGRVSGAAIVLSDSELDCNPVVRNARSQVRVPLEGLPDPYPAVCNNALKLLACSFVVKLDEAECPQCRTRSVLRH